MNARRACGECQLCCTLLRVDELAKLGGTPCQKLGADGCGIYETRPQVCRRYRCLWLSGGLREEDRPDQLGAILDRVPHQGGERLAVRELTPGAFECSPRLQAIAAEFRELMPVQITDSADVMDPDRPFRMLFAEGVEHVIEGDTTTVLCDGAFVREVRLGVLARTVRRLTLRVRALWLARLSGRGPAGF